MDSKKPEPFEVTDLVDLWNGSCNDSALARFSKFLGNRSQAEIAQIAGVSQSTISRAPLSLKAVESLAAKQGYVARLMLVRLNDRDGQRVTRADEPLLHKEDGPWFQLLLASLAFQEPGSMPHCIIDSMIRITGAKNAVYYSQLRGSSILKRSSVPYGLTFPELMEGPSWAYELPSQVLRRGTVWPIRIHEKYEKSAFASREKTTVCVGIPIPSAGAQAKHAVLLLNYSEFKEWYFSAPFLDSCRRAASLFSAMERLVDDSAASSMNVRVAKPAAETNNATSRAKKSATAMRRREPSRVTAATIEFFRKIFDHTNHRDALDWELADLLRGLVELRSKKPASEHLNVSVYWTPSPIDLSETIRRPPLQVSPSNVQLDKVVEDSYLKGTTFFSDEIHGSRCRERFGDRRGLHSSIGSKLTIPIRCEWVNEEIDEVQLGEHGSHHIYERTVEEKHVGVYGVIDVESSGDRGIGANTVYDLAILGNLVASSLYLRGRVASMKCKAGIVATLLQNVVESLERSGNGSIPTLRVLDPFCNACLKIFPEFDRCAIYRLDHRVNSFAQVGHVYDRAVMKSFNEAFLQPRLGGTSERMKGIVDQYHLILDPEKDPRVNPISKMQGARCLLGMTFRANSSFIPNGVIWLGQHGWAKKGRRAIGQEYLKKEELPLMCLLAAVLVQIISDDADNEGACE